MNFRRVRRSFCLGAILLPAMIGFGSSTPKKSQLAHAPVSRPAGIGQLTADGTAPTTAGYTEEAKDQPDAQQFDGCVTTKWGGRRKLLNSSSLHVLGFGCAERMRSRPWLLYSQRGCGTGESFSKAYCCFGGLRLV